LIYLSQRGRLGRAGGLVVPLKQIYCLSYSLQSAVSINKGIVRTFA